MTLATAFVCSIVLLFGFVQLSSSQSPPSIISCSLTPQTGTPFGGTLTFACQYNIGISGVGQTIPGVTWTVLRGRSISGPIPANNTDFIPAGATTSSGSCTQRSAAVDMFDCTNINSVNDPNSVTFKFTVNDAIRASNWTFRFEATNSYDNSITSDYTVPLLQPQLTLVTSPSNSSALASYIAGDTVPLSLTVSNPGQSAFNSPIACLITFNSGLTPSGTALPTGCSITSTSSVRCTTTGSTFAASASQVYAFNATYSGGAASGSVLSITCQDVKTLFPAQLKSVSIGGTQSPSRTPSISLSPSATPSSSVSPNPNTASSQHGSQGNSESNGSTNNDGGNNNNNGGGVASRLFSWTSMLV